MDRRSSSHSSIPRIDRRGTMAAKLRSIRSRNRATGPFERGTKPLDVFDSRHRWRPSHDSWAGEDNEILSCLLGVGHPTQVTVYAARTAASISPRILRSLTSTGKYETAVPSVRDLDHNSSPLRPRIPVSQRGRSVFSAASASKLSLGLGSTRQAAKGPVMTPRCFRGTLGRIALVSCSMTAIALATAPANSKFTTGLTGLTKGPIRKLALLALLLALFRCSRGTKARSRSRATIR